MNKSRIIVSSSKNPYFNLALEEYLIERKIPTLYLWQNADTVVIGRNQNPYKECDLNSMKRDGVNLVRRRSGGGAVFHDLGNLNFTIISKKKRDNVKRNFEFVLKVLSELGIDGEYTGRNDIHVSGKKISGNAFYEDEDIFCHHGTMLMDTDVSVLSEYLTVSDIKLRTKGIDSVRSRIANLCDFKPGLSLEKVLSTFIDVYSGENYLLEPEYINENYAKYSTDILKKQEKYSSWNWTYGESPDFDISLEDKFNWGLVEICLSTESGVIKKAKIYTDSLEDDAFNVLSDKLIGQELRTVQINKVVNENIHNEEIALSIMDMMNRIS